GHAGRAERQRQRACLADRAAEDGSSRVVRSAAFLRCRGAMSDDYSAAFSMDSAWYAVDKRGHVARFETGKAGAMPNDAADELSCPLVDALLATNAQGVELVVDDLVEQADGAIFQVDWDTPLDGWC